MVLRLELAVGVASNWRGVLGRRVAGRCISCRFSCTSRVISRGCPGSAVVCGIKLLDNRLDDQRNIYSCMLVDLFCWSVVAQVLVLALFKTLIAQSFLRVWRSCCVVGGLCGGFLVAFLLAILLFQNILRSLLKLSNFPWHEVEKKTWRSCMRWFSIFRLP